MKLAIKFLLLTTFYLLGHTVKAQNLFYADNYHGGVTVGGLSCGTGMDYTDTLFLHIPNGSTIRKALIFVYTEGLPKQEDFKINSSVFNFNINNRIMNVNYQCSCATPTRLYYKEITSFISALATDTFIVTVPGADLTGTANSGWYLPILYIEYENPSMQKVNVNLWINNQDYMGYNSYSCQNMNPINTTFPVGLSIFDDRACSLNDGTVAIVNGNNLGTIGGSDSVNYLQHCGGAKGHFYYENQNLYGLDDDLPDNIMHRTDALADISSYLSNNAIGYNLILHHAKYPSQNKTAPNPHLLFINAYVSPCDTFSVSVSNDTTICYGETLQLHASGGTQYEWSATSGGQAALNELSCTNCPNPVFSGDTSRVYTVRIWNGDSCSVVRPVKITVSPPLEKAQFGTSPAICGIKNNGRIFLSGAQPSLWDTLWAVTPEGDTLQTAGTALSGLSPGDYTVFYTNSYGCSSTDTVVNVGATIITNAQFTAQPTHGSAPLQVSLTNTSQNATDYSWWLGGTYQGNSFSGFLADTSGTYHIQLIAWNGDSLCADTASVTVVVYDSLVMRIPNVFTPNVDGVNDHFTITVNMPVETKLVILNRWGNVVHEWEGKLHEGQNVLWNGSSSGSFSYTQNTKVSDGTYFYKFVFTDLPGKEKGRKVSGFVVVR